MQAAGSRPRSPFIRNNGGSPFPNAPARTTLAQTTSGRVYDTGGVDSLGRCKPFSWASTRRKAFDAQPAHSQNEVSKENRAQQTQIRPQSAMAATKEHIFSRENRARQAQESRPQSAMGVAQNSFSRENAARPRSALGGHSTHRQAEREKWVARTNAPLSARGLSGNSGATSGRIEFGSRAAWKDAS